MRRILAGLLCAMALPAGAGATVADSSQDAPRGSLASCMRHAGDGITSVVGARAGRVYPVDLYTARAAGFDRRGRVPLGRLEECPESAAAGGHVLVAGIASSGRGSQMAARFVSPAGSLSSRVLLGRAGRVRSVPLAVDVAASGDAVVAWVQRRQARRGVERRTVVARRPAGGSLARALPVTAWTRTGELRGGPAVAAEVDERGRTTVVWTAPLPDRGRIGDLSAVRVATASRGAAFGPPQTVVRDIQDVTTLALAAAPDGGQLLAHEDANGVAMYDRRPSESLFAPSGRLRPSGLAAAAEPAVALRNGGGAVVAFRDSSGKPDSNAGVIAATRSRAGAFGVARRVARRLSGPSSGSVFGFSGGAPLDGLYAPLRAALVPDGRAILTWAPTGREAFSGRPVRALFVSGTLERGFGAPRRGGCPCRGVSGLVPAILPGAGPAALFVDSLTDAAPLGIEFPSEGARLHVALAGAPEHAPAPAPSLKVSARPQVLRHGQGISIRVRCGAPCDLRAVSLGRKVPTALGVASLRRAGAHILRVTPASDKNLAPRRRGRVRIGVRAYNPGADSFSQRTIAVRARRRPVRRPPLPIDVRAVRRGRRIVVTWRTARPARGVEFSLNFTAGTSQSAITYTGPPVKGRGRTRFQASFRVPRRLLKIELESQRVRQPLLTRTVRVPIPQRR